MLNAELRVLDGKHEGKSIPLSVKKFLVGREQDCQLRPNSDLVSRHHCVFTIDDFSVRLRDLGSTNGTYVNGTRLTGVVVLQPGDQVSIGKLNLELVVLAEAPFAPEAAPEVAPAQQPSIEGDTLHGGADTQDGFVLPELMSGDTAMLDSAAMPLENSAVLVPAGQETVQVPAMQGYYPPGYPQMMPGQMMPGQMVPGQMMPGQMAPGQMPAGMMPQMPGYPQMPAGYPQMMPGYPQMMPGMMPGMGSVAMGAYPQMMMPGMMPGMVPAGMGTVQMPAAGNQAAPPVAPPSAGGGADKVNKVIAPPMMLPPPEETGAQAPAPKPAPAPAADGTKAPPSVNPSSAAADIIRQHMQKRR
jgi:hypothetical protein